MAKCDLCGKSVVFGNSVSHSNHKVSAMWKPNIKKVRVNDNGRVTNKHVCTRCIRTGKVIKAV